MTAWAAQQSLPSSSKMGLLDLILNSGLMVQFVLLMLIAASVLCWTIIAYKHRMIQAAAKDDARFLNVFWTAKSLEEIFKKVDHYDSSPVASVFKSGFKELKKVTESKKRDEMAVANIQRSLNRAATLEIAALEKHVNWLATTASAAPFIGLFGTVWGIMNSFQSIGATGSANLAVVAPGISEALIATATGLAAAIPAVVAYNHFVGKIKKASMEMEGFCQDLLNIVNRSINSSKD